MTEKQALVALNLVKGLGSIKINALLKHFKSALGVFSASVKELKQVDGISDKIINGIAKILDSDEFKKELNLIQKQQIKLIAINESDYPKNLKEIPDPPVVLYVKGDILDSDSLAISIVGSRRASFYGLSLAEKTSYELASLGITVISGLARGIDTKAHNGAIRAKGRTIAVLGSGLNMLYPPENKALAEEIQTSGAVISEFSMNARPIAGNFPRRNRVISGLSLGVVVVEAARNSGALITARLGLEQGREIFSVPGRVDSQNSYGTNRLIKDGAKLFNSVEDILEELKPRLKEKLQKKEESLVPEKNIPLSLTGNLSSEEANVYNLLSTKPLYFDDIAKQSSLELNKILSCLLQLELKHLVKQLPGKAFVKLS